MPNVPLIPQDKSNACWLACAAMLKSWKDHTPYTLDEVADFLDSPGYNFSGIYNSNSGLPFTYNSKLAQQLNLIALPPASYQLNYMKNLLTTSPIASMIMPAPSQPLTHFVVITGMVGGTNVHTTKLKINDPWPVNGGKQYEITFMDFINKFEEVVRYEDGFPAEPLTSQLYHY